MKTKISILVLLFFGLSIYTNAQFRRLNPYEGYFGGGFGVTWIDDKPHYTFHLFPELAFANFGVGLDLNLEFDSNGQIRSENFNEFSDYLSIIRYVRYGLKGDPFYARLGALDYATLGHGSLMYLYNNSPSYDTRKIGMELDMDLGFGGFEGVYSSFGEEGVVGFRGFVRPLQFTEAADIPIIGNFEIGATYITDFNPYAGVTGGSIDPATNEFKPSQDFGTVQAYGFDLGLPIIKTSLARLDLYFDYAKIVDFGEGQTIGALLRLNGLGLVNLQAKLERRLNGDHYLPAYFNSFYEIERFKFDESTGQVSSKVQQLEMLTSVGNGFYGELLVRVLGTFDILGSYQRLDEHPKSGILHLETDISPEGFPYVARAGYDKINIQNETDIFTLDDRSYLFAELGYKPMPYLLVSVVYHWTFTPVRDESDNIIDFEPQKKIEPRVSFVYPFDIGN